MRVRLGRAQNPFGIAPECLRRRRGSRRVSSASAGRGGAGVGVAGAVTDSYRNDGVQYRIYVYGH